MKYGLKAEIIEKINAVFAQFKQVEKVVIYGSRAKNSFRTGSDIDLTLFGDDLNLKILHQIEDSLDDLLLPYKFDLSIFSKIDNPDFIDHIKRVGIIFYQKK